MVSSADVSSRDTSSQPPISGSKMDKTEEQQKRILACEDTIMTVKPPRVVNGHIVYRGEVKVGHGPPTPLSKTATFASPSAEDPDKAWEALAGDYDGSFPEVTTHDICTTVKLRGSTEDQIQGRKGVKATLSATGRLEVESYLSSACDLSNEPVGQDLMAPYVVEDIRRLIYLRDGKISRSRSLESRKAACNSLARLACLRKALAEVEEGDRCLTNASSAEALLELESSLGGALAYCSSDGRHPAVYIQIASLFPTSLYLQVKPAEFQKILLGVFARAWDKLGAASRRHAEKISHVLDFSCLSQLDIAAYSTHRLLGDIGEVLRGYTPWLVYKIVVYKFRFAKDLIWELMRPACQTECRVVMADCDEELAVEIQADGPFILHTLGGFNESSFLRCRRPVYRLRHPPQPLASSEWFSGGSTCHFWDEMRKLHEEAPWAAPEPDPVEDVELQDSEDVSALVRERQQEKREEALISKSNELKKLIESKECLVPHFKKAVKQVLNAPHETDMSVEFPGRLQQSKDELIRPAIDMKNVTRSDVKVCMWKLPSDAAEAKEGTAQMLLKLFEKRKQWTRPPLPANYMSAFERTTYSLDCVYHAPPKVQMRSTKSRVASSRPLLSDEEHHAVPPLAEAGGVGHLW